jgi:hypothetical protein
LKIPDIDDMIEYDVETLCKAIEEELSGEEFEPDSSSLVEIVAAVTGVQKPEELPFHV